MQQLLAWSSGDEGLLQDYKVKDQVFKSRGVQKKTNFLVWNKYGVCWGLMWDLGRGWVGFKGRLRLDGLFVF